MKSEELLEIIKLIPGARIVAHDLSQKQYDIVTTYRLLYRRSNVVIHSPASAIDRINEATFLNDFKGCFWQLQIVTSDLMKLVTRKKVNLVDVSLSCGVVRLSHSMYVENDKLYDTGIDGREYATTISAFGLKNRGKLWTINEVSIEENHVV